MVRLLWSCWLKDSIIAGSQDFANREISTTVKVKDGETVVLGGVYEEESNKRIIGSPI